MARIHTDWKTGQRLARPRPLIQLLHLASLARASFAILIGIPLLCPGIASAEEKTKKHTASTTAGVYLCKYKPNYFILGMVDNREDRPTTKFQFSFRYVIWSQNAAEDEKGGKGGHHKRSCGHVNSPYQLQFGYTQKSIWKLYEDSSPFEENNYNPEIHLSIDSAEIWEGFDALDWITLGFEHESNGEEGDRSRSWNRAYLQTRFKWDNIFGDKDDKADKADKTENGDEHAEEVEVAHHAEEIEGAKHEEVPDRIGWEARFYAKVWAIVQSNDKTDYGRNIGHFKLIAALESPDYPWGSVAFELEGSVGDDFDRGNLLAGISYGLPLCGKGRFVPQIYLQYFEGYGESLVRSDELTRALRMGIRFLR